VARVDRLTAAGVLILALMACLHALRLGLWKTGLPGSGLFPLLGARGMALLAVLLLATSWRSPEQKKATPLWPRGDALKKRGTAHRPRGGMAAADPLTSLHGLLTGFQVALTPVNVLYCFIGCFLGTLIGVLILFAA
jgi:hypothetical protein